MKGDKFWIDAHIDKFVYDTQTKILNRQLILTGFRELRLTYSDYKEYIDREVICKLNESTKEYQHSQNPHFIKWSTRSKEMLKWYKSEFPIKRSNSKKRPQSISLKELFTEAGYTEKYNELPNIYTDPKPRELWIMLLSLQELKIIPEKSIPNRVNKSMLYDELMQLLKIKNDSRKTFSSCFNKQIDDNVKKSMKKQIENLLIGLNLIK